MSYTGLNASAATVTFAGHTLSAVEYPGGILYFVRSGSAVEVTEAEPLPVKLGAAIPAGSNTIGSVNLAANNAGTISTAILTMPGLAATENSVTVKPDVANEQQGLTAITPAFAAVGVATSGDQTLVAAVSAKKLQVSAIFLMAASAVNVYLRDGGGGTAMIGNSTGPIPLAANTGFVLPYKQSGWCRGGTNTALTLNLSASVAIGGVICYSPVT